LYELQSRGERELPIESYSSILVAIIIGFIVVYLTTPKFARRLGERGLTGVDVHKPQKPKIPTMGGVVLLAGYLSGMMFSLAAFPTFIKELTGVLTTILMIAMVGMIDDILQLQHSIKVVLPIVASLPLMLIVSEDRVMLLPFIGLVKIGVVYPLLLVPIGVVAAANLTNLLAGFNGLETGMGLMAIISLSVCALLLGSVKGLTILAPMIGPLLAFLVFNWYPARIFPGNSGTYMIGAVIAAGVIIGDMEVVGIVCMIPYVVEFFLKVRNLFRGQCFGLVNDDGTLSAPKPFIESLTHIFMRLRRFTEPRLVTLLLLTEAVFGVIAIVVTYLNIYYLLIPG
jgi:UDP-N-acetylglucosamine--dolichyl-phosphate N-acetylglucosaminephosphotransferase